MLPLAATCLLLLGPSLGGAVKIVPKLEFEDTSPGISPDHSKTFLEKEISVNPGVVKALLEVKVGESLVTIKPDKKGDKDSKTTKILICDAWGECKLHEVVRGKEDDDDDDKDEEDEDEGGKKKLKPVIVTDFDEDPLADKDDDDDGKKKKGPGTHYGPGVYDHDPGVYDHSPGVYDHSPGVYDHSPGVYDHSPGIPDYGHGDHNYGADGYGHVGWHGYNPTTSGHGSRVDRIPVYYGMKLSPEFHQPYPGLVLDEEASRPYHGGYYDDLYHHGPFPEPQGHYPDVIPYDHPYFSGRTPTPYGKFYTTTRPGSYHAIITPLGRKTGVRWPPAVAVVGKMDLPQDELTAPTERPSVIKIDGKLGEALAKDEKEQ
ncbi:uncharacterized protein [Periplaneta americana]|uniref:uncharacterized protein isoform X2 n=1 Tax=Periplaneta americana TaxID=6978 RepID=UPI0037E93781